MYKEIKLKLEKEEEEEEEGYRNFWILLYAVSNLNPTLGFIIDFFFSYIM